MVVNIVFLLIVWRIRAQHTTESSSSRNHLVHIECETWEPFRGLNQTDTSIHKDNRETEHWIIALLQNSVWSCHNKMRRHHMFYVYVMPWTVLIFCKSSSVNVCRELDRSLIYCMIWWTVYDVHLITGYSTVQYSIGIFYVLFTGITNIKSIMNLLQYTFPTFIYCIFLCIYSRNAQDMSDRIDTSRAIAWIIGVLTIGNTPSRNYALMDAILACINWGNVYADKKESLFPKGGRGCSRGSRTL
jgi:membrane-associated HD superfamily phosphohydrolase